MRGLFLILLSIAIVFTAWGGYCKSLGIQAHILSNTNNELSGMLGRAPAFPKPTLQHFLSGKFQARMEKSTGDCVPFLEQMIPLLTYWKSFLYELSLTALPKKWSPVLPIGEKGYVRIRGKEQLLPTPSTYKPEIAERMRKAANYFSEIASKWPMVRFYVFAIPSKQAVFVETKAWPDIPTQLFGGCQDLNQFGTLLSKNVAYDWFGKTHPPGQALGFYYNTDHHLITPGMYEIYRQLYHLISSGGGGINEVVQCKNWFVVPNVIFRGSYSRLSGGYERATDDLMSCLFELPEYAVTVHGAKHGEGRNKRLAYETGMISKDPFFNHPAEYFGYDRGLVEYAVGKVSEQKNLLVIGDSNDNSIEPLLAAHFSRSFFVDVRHFAKDTGQRFSLDTFISQNGITDVLFIGSHWTTVLRDPDAGQDTQERFD